MLTRLLAVLVLMGATASAQTSQPAPQDRKGQAEADDSQPVQAPPQQVAPATISVSPTFVQNSPSGDKDGDDSSADADWAMVRWTAAATIIGFVLAVIAGVQLNSQTKQTSEALKYARDGLEHTIAATKLQMRAWVTVAKMELRRLPQAGDNPTVCIEFKNGGATPALEVAISGNVFIRRAGHVATVEAEKVEGHPGSSRSIIGADELMTTVVDLGHELDEAQVQALTSGVTSFFAVGTVTYKDIFGDSHRTRFAYQGFGPGMAIKSKTGEVPLYACPQGNSAD